MQIAPAVISKTFPVYKVPSFIQVAENEKTYTKTPNKEGCLLTTPIFGRGERIRNSGPLAPHASALNAEAQGSYEP